MDIITLQATLQDALDDISSSCSSNGRCLRALNALEHLLALDCMAISAQGDQRSFMLLQDTFECNVSSRLMPWIASLTSKLEVLSSKTSIDANREIELSTLISHLSQALSIIQGISLNHNRSKAFLGRRNSLEILLELFSACRHLQNPMPLANTTTNTPNGAPRNAMALPLPSVILDTLLCLLVDSSAALRAFEDCSGLQAVVKVLKTAGTQREVKMKCLEFLYFYLMDESSPGMFIGVADKFEKHTKREPSSPTKAPPSPTKRAHRPLSPTRTAPSTPTHTRITTSASSPSKPRFKLKVPTGLRSTEPSGSSSSALSGTWGSISSFSSDLSASTSTTTPDQSPTSSSLQVPKTPPGPTLSPLPSHQDPSSDQNIDASKPSRPRPLVLRKDVDIDYVPISPKKPKMARVGSGMALPGSKVRELRELSTGSRSMPVMPNINTATPTKNPFGSVHVRGQGDIMTVEEGSAERRSVVKSAEEKKEILGGMLGNVDALVEGVRKAGIWGLE